MAFTGERESVWTADGDDDMDVTVEYDEEEEDLDDIDAYWLQRKIFQAYGLQIDPQQCQKLMTKIAGTLLERENKGGSSPWADLPQELLEIISKSLNIIDYQNLGRVCRSWRLFYSEFKQSFLTSHPPFIVYSSAQVTKYCYFFDITTGMKYKRKLPPYIWDFKFCLGVASGYLILFCLKTKDVSRSYLSVINPFTGHQIQFPCMPQPPGIDYYNHKDRGIFRSIFASFGSQGEDFLIMILSKYGSSLQFCTSRDNKWKEYHYVNKNWRILDIVVFDGRIYVLNSDYQIGILNLISCDLRFLELKFAPDFGNIENNLIRLVASNDQLFVVEFPQVYRIDLSRMEWVKVYNLGDQVLFHGYGDMMCSPATKATKWEGQKNCEYRLSFCFNIHVLQPQKTFTIELPEQGFWKEQRLWKDYDGIKICSWYFLDQSIENVRDE